MAENPYEAPQAQLNAPATDSGDEFASRWKRLWGALLDTLIVSLVNVPLMIASGYMGKAMEQTVSVLEIALFGVAAYVIFMLINGYSLHARGQTLGKMIVGTQIASAETRDRLPLTRVALMRYLPMHVVSIIPLYALILWLIDTLFIFRRDKRCVHDLIAGTVVIDYRG